MSDAPALQTRSGLAVHAVVRGRDPHDQQLFVAVADNAHVNDSAHLDAKVGERP